MFAEIIVRFEYKVFDLRLWSTETLHLGMAKGYKDKRKKYRTRLP